MVTVTGAASLHRLRTRTLATSRRGVAEKWRSSPPASRRGVPGSAFAGATVNRSNCPFGVGGDFPRFATARGWEFLLPGAGRSSAPTSPPNSVAGRRQPSRPSAHQQRQRPAPAAANRGGLADDDGRATCPTTAHTSRRSTTRHLGRRFRGAGVSTSLPNRSPNDGRRGHARIELVGHHGAAGDHLTIPQLRRDARRRADTRVDAADSKDLNPRDDHYKSSLVNHPEDQRLWESGEPRECPAPRKRPWRSGRG